MILMTRALVLLLMGRVIVATQQQQQQPQQVQQHPTTTEVPTRQPTTMYPFQSGGPIQSIFNPFALSAQGILHGAFELGKGLAGVLQNTVNSVFNSWTYPNFKPPPPIGFEYFNKFWENQFDQHPTTQATTPPPPPRTTPRPQQQQPQQQQG